MGLRLLDPQSLFKKLKLLPQELALEKDISSFLQNELKVHWATRTDFDEEFFNAICRIVAGALNPRPTHRWTPARTLEELDNIGRKLTVPPRCNKNASHISPTTFIITPGEFWHSLSVLPEGALPTSSQLIVTASEFIDVKLDQGGKKYLEAALRRGIFDDSPKRADRELFYYYLAKSGPSLRLGIVDVLVDEALSESLGCKVPKQSHSLCFPNYPVITDGPVEHGIMLATETGLHNIVNGNEAKLNLMKGVFSKAGMAGRDVLRGLVAQQVPLLVAVLATGVDVKSNLILFITTLYILFHEDKDTTIQESVAIIPEALVQYLAGTVAGVGAMPSLSLLADCKMALTCLNEFGPTAFSNHKAILPLLDLLVADGGRLVIACDSHRFIKEKCRADRYFSDSFKLPVESILPDGCNKTELSTKRQRGVYNALVLNVIRPRRYRILGLSCRY